jgi:hypothetical protein
MARAAENLQALGHFQAVADGAAQRLVHVGDERGHFLAHAPAGIDHHLGQMFGVLRPSS